MSKLLFCYIYLDPRKPGEWYALDFKFDFEPICVGIGSGSRELDHLKRKDVHPLTSKLKSLAKSGISPIILKIRHELNLQDAKELEIALIAGLGRKCLKAGPLLNLTGGGSGNFDPSPETRKKLSSSGFAGKKHSAETKLKIAIKNSQHPTAKARGRLLGLSNFGKKHNEEVNLKKGRGGSLNSRAKHWMIEKDDGEFELVIGEFKLWCKNNGTSVHRCSSKMKKKYCET